MGERTIDLFERGSFDLRTSTTGDTANVLGFRYREFGVHQRIGGDMLADWTFSHLPSGLRFPGWFKTVEAAAEAAVEFARLRNEWENLSHDDLAAIREPARAICDRHGGTWGTAKVEVPKSYVAPALNGFTSSQPEVPHV